MMDATDYQLLERFVTLHDEAAFSTLAHRHAALVLGVCRRVLRNEHDAEDTFQATFLVLARKAGGLPCRESVGPWLSGVAYRLALHARTARGRCRVQPVGLLLGDGAEALDLPSSLADPETETGRRELSRLVREELARLPEKYRAPVTLCYLEGKTNEQAARELGWPSGSMSRRLERGRQLLHERLTGRGIGLLILLLCLLAWRWTGHRAERMDDPPVRVADAMRSFRPGTQEVLERVAEARSSAPDGEILVALAADAARVAERIEHHDPGQRQDEWKRYTLDMSAAARQLDYAARFDDRPATRRAAERLVAACVRCHETFRD
jgi:RNA polymerase sigma-70 factor (ECF subfamily)